MNKVITLALLFSFTLVGTGHAQSLENLLDGLIVKYSETESVSLDFTLVLQPAEMDEETYTGKFHRKGERLLVESDMQTVISDGKDAWIYIPDNEEIQIVDADGEEAGLSPQALLEQFYNDDYQYRSQNTATPAEVLVEFVPNDKDEDIFKVQMIIDKKVSLVREIRAFQKNGDRYTMRLANQQFDIDLDDALFVFDKSKYPGVHIEDLRLD